MYTVRLVYLIDKACHHSRIAVQYIAICVKVYDSTYTSVITDNVRTVVSYIVTLKKFAVSYRLISFQEMGAPVYEQRIGALYSQNIASILP